MEESHRKLLLIHPYHTMRIRARNTKTWIVTVDMYLDHKALGAQQSRNEG